VRGSSIRCFCSKRNSAGACRGGFFFFLPDRLVFLTTGCRSGRWRLRPCGQPDDFPRGLGGVARVHRCRCLLAFVNALILS
jgi:hypothetical protein